MKRLKLAVEKRKVVGKKVKKLRKEGILPANLYGKDVKSLAVEVPYKEFEKVYKEVGETGLVDVVVNGQIRPSLIHNIHHDYLHNRALHVDFYQVNLKEKVKTMIPLVIKGEAKAVSDKVGLLLQPLTQVEVEALPEDLPERIEVDVKALSAVGDQITIGQIKPPSKVTILANPSLVAVKIGELVSKEAAELAAAEAAAREAAKAAAETAQAGQVPEGQVPQQEAPKEGEQPQGPAGQAKTEPGKEAGKPETPPKK